MTALFRCDNCAVEMPQDGDRISLDIVRALQPVEPDADGFVELQQITFFPTGEHHFCSMGCLSSWAMGKAIDDAEGAS